MCDAEFSIAHRHVDRSRGYPQHLWQVRIRIKGSPEIVQNFPSDADARAFARVTERKIRTGHGHEAISRMVLHKRKLSPFEIMKIVGHSSLAILNRYANLRGSDLVDRMD